MTICIDELNYVKVENTSIDELAEFIITQEMKKQDLQVQLQAVTGRHDTLLEELRNLDCLLRSVHSALNEHLCNKARRRRHTVMV